MAKERNSARVSITLTEWMTALEDCCREGGIEFADGNWSESQSNLDELLSCHPALGDSVFRLYGDKMRRTLRRDLRAYEAGAIVVRNVDLALDTSDWTPLRVLRGLFFHGLHLEECTIEMSGTTGVLDLRFARGVCFRRTRFDAGERFANVPRGFPDVSAPWLVNLDRGDAIAFEECRFANGFLQIRAFGNPKQGTAGSGERRGDEDDRSDGEESSPSGTESRGAEMLVAGGETMGHALRRVTLVGNEIRSVDVVSATRELVVRGGNRLGSVQLMQLNGGDRACPPSGVSLGMFEKIDPAFRDPMGHREIFLHLKHMGADSKDDALVRAAGAQIDRIEHRLVKDDPVTCCRAVSGRTRFTCKGGRFWDGATGSRTSTGPGRDVWLGFFAGMSQRPSWRAGPCGHCLTRTPSSRL